MGTTERRWVSPQTVLAALGVGLLELGGRVVTGAVASLRERVTA